MIEILRSFEQVAGGFSPMVLLVPGLALVALGLLIWLAGMCLRRIVLGLAGAAAGAIISFLIGGQSPVVAGLAAGGGAVFGAILPRLFMAVLLAVSGVAVAFTIVAATHLAEGQGTLFGQQDSGRPEGKFTVQESLDAVRAYSLDVADCVKAAARKMEPVGWAIVAATGVGVLTFGLLFVRLTGAWTCSLLGTAMIFTGLILLLVLKGSAPIAHVEQQGVFYGAVLLGMAAFGTLEQLVLCPSPRREHRTKSGKSRSKRAESEGGWRNR